MQEILKILRQYTKLLTQACLDKTPQSAHGMALSPTPVAYPRNLEWFEPLALPFRGLDRAGFQRVDQLLELDAACNKLDPSLSNKRQHAFELAKALPHFDYDLTATYLQPSPTTPEYELHVAHSILRLHNPQTLEDLQTHLKTWRSQGLLHVLGVAALNMPALTDWFPAPCEDKDDSTQSLLYCLETLSSRPLEYAHAIDSFIATQTPENPTAQSIATTLDRLAILMGVKSNATDELGHDLSAALSIFPHLDTLELQDAWSRIKPALENSLPPSLLRVDPAWGQKRAKQAKGTW